MIIVRQETPLDACAIRDVEAKAFGRSAEADLVDTMRKRGTIALSLVALDSGRIVGHILFSPVSILEEGGSFSAVGLGPLAVLPEFQRRGIGARLVCVGLEKCRQQGHDVAVVLGSPTYYQRFGFFRADRYGLRLEGVPPENFMAVELRQGTLAGKGGVVKYQPEFDDV